MHNYTQPYSDFVSAIRKIKAGRIEHLTFGEQLAVDERYLFQCHKKGLHYSPLTMLRYIADIKEE